MEAGKEVMGEVIWIWVGFAAENWLLVGEACIAEAGVGEGEGGEEGDWACEVDEDVRIRGEAVMLGEESEGGWMVRGVRGSCIELTSRNLVLDDSI